jgi:hypothetical protein
VARDHRSQAEATGRRGFVSHGWLV